MILWIGVFSVDGLETIDSSSCPQGSCTGPVFWKLVDDEVLRQDWPQGVHLQAFADDFVFLVNAGSKQEVKNLANKALQTFKTWTDKHKLEISLDKTNYLHINKNRSGPICNKEQILNPSPRAEECRRNKLGTQYKLQKTAVSNGGGKGHSPCLSSMGPQHHCQTTETPVFYPKKVFAQYHRGVQHHPNGGYPGRRSLEDRISHGGQVPSKRTPIEVYTDGSRINDQKGSAFCAIANEAITKTWKAKLSPANTVFQAEMLALKAGIEWANTANEEVNIWSDSESSFQALKSLNVKSKITQEAQMTLLENARISICWVKAHIGIKGNEIADTLAKDATTDEIPVSLPFRKIS
ncbi:hypothetical protein AVEN_197745-1 [Araneus ventricosus]|uniref:ribonuclease H n=1 Tax=Araneus ventricosus TaxID=182803 RepID=A0A4Y2CLA5_ARAVE|nr:hypothetical protein AVEN_197745-1 [Araneus ventricosus]